MFKQIRHAALGLLLAGMLPTAASPETAGVDPAAEKLLKSATTFLAGQKRLSVDTRSTIEVVLDSGQKIQFDNAARMTLQRPNKFRAERVGDLVNQVFYYDGKSFTLHNPDDGFYATVAAPPTIEETMDFARDSLDIVAPAGDFLYSNAFDILMQGATSGFIVGKAVIEGVRCDHLAFRNADVDFQVWIQEGNRPLPRKLVITSRDVAGAPQFEVRMTKWDLAPKIAPQLFDFTAPKKARRIDFVTRAQAR